MLCENIDDDESMELSMDDITAADNAARPTPTKTSMNQCSYVLNVSETIVVTGSTIYSVQLI